MTEERRAAPARHLAEEVGQRLRGARQQRGESLADVEEATRIRAAYLEALEEGHPERLPAEVYARGFLRAYADHLGLDGAALLETYKGTVPADVPVAQGEVPATVSRPGPARPAGDRGRRAPRRRRPSAGSRRGPAPYVAWVLLAAAVGTAGWVGFAVSGRFLAQAHRRASPGRVRTVAKQGATTGGGAGTASKTSAVGGRVGSTTSSAVTPTNGTGAALQGVARHTSFGWVTTYVVAGAGPLNVQVLATGRCWTRRWADGSAQYSDALLTPGTSVVWTAAQALRVELGNTNVRLRVNGVDTTALPPQGPHNPEWVDIRTASSASSTSRSAAASASGSAAATG